MKEKNDIAEVKLLNEELANRKKEISQEEENIRLGRYELNKLQENHDRGQEELDLKIEAAQLIEKLYPSLGEEYVSSKLWKDYVLKVQKFELKKLKKQKKSLTEGLVMGKNQIQSQVGQREHLVSRLKTRIKEIKKELSQVKKNDKKMYG